MISIKISDIPKVLDTLNPDQIELFNVTVDRSLKKCINPDTEEEFNLDHEHLKDKEITYGEVFKTLTKEQRYALYFTIEMAIADVKNNNEGDN